jgi:UDP-galactopyranose mutase
MRSGLFGQKTSQRDSSDAVFYANISYSPLSQVAAAWRQHRAARFLERAASNRLSSPIVAWIYHPALLRLALSLPHAALVYDVMDRFAAFSASPGMVSEEEKRALECADIVFTGGRSLHAGCPGINPNMHCFPSGVDLDHFARACSDQTDTPQEMRTLPHPVLGYFGAVDERVDFELLDFVCRAEPSWSIVLIGPVLAKPTVHRPNLHMLGARPYGSLPGYLKAFDVCLIPFRQTELVRFVSPTKTPEYLAGGKPVVSTPIPDVAADYGDVVSIADSPTDFLAACRGYMARQPDSSSLCGAAVSRARTWAQLAGEMEQIILDHLSPRGRSAR